MKMKQIFSALAITAYSATLLVSSAFATDSLLPLRETLEEQGYTVTWNTDSSITITKDDFSLTEPIGDTLIMYKGTTYAPESFIDGLNATGKQDEYVNASIVEVGKDYVMVSVSENPNNIMLRVDDETNIHHATNKMIYKIDALKAGMTVSVKMSDAMTMSLPPQVYAYEIIVVAEPMEYVQSVVKSVEDNQITAALSDENKTELIFNVNEATVIHTNQSTDAIELSAVKEGSIIDVSASNAMTRSVPAQVYAYEITVIE